jgi:hypothetical protein
MLLVAVIFSSCSEDENDVYNPDALISATSRVSNIYIAGTGRNEDGQTFPTYWKNGTAVTLSASYPGAIVYNGNGYGGTVSNNAVYVCGAIYTSIGNIATYWKNGKAVFLPGHGAQAQDIALMKNNVYVSGAVTVGDGNHPGDGNHAVIWKNGVISYLSNPSIPSAAEAIAISGKDLYVGGHIIEDGRQYPVYWKNGFLVVLPSGENPASVTSLVVNGSDVYAAGYELGNSRAKYWKNGEVVNLSDGLTSVDNIYAVFVNGSDVYAAGRRRTLNSLAMVVWKNGTIISASPTTASEVEVSDISLDGSNILVVGTELFVNANSSFYANATLWRNGVSEVLDKGADGVNPYFGSSITVSK